MFWFQHKLGFLTELIGFQKIVGPRILVITALVAWLRLISAVVRCSTFPFCDFT